MSFGKSAFFTKDVSCLLENWPFLPKTLGDMPKRQIKFIAAWTEIHKDELIANWELAINEEPLYKIEPLR
ncbi:DUF4160 domain-containing protein [uncultured Phascolarctobacterium sp.]|uniref:DUF4160 domain-containing protein n=1 Tax=uncultured Phascolarctobacterium sp. TaxID=512296 RepID=UPI00343DECD4